MEFNELELESGLGCHFHQPLQLANHKTFTEGGQLTVIANR